MGRKAKATQEMTAEQKALKLIAENPGLLEALALLSKSATQKPTATEIIDVQPPPAPSTTVIAQRPRRLYKPAKPQVPFDDPNVGRAEGLWDKKRYPKKVKFEASPRRESTGMTPVRCACGKVEYIQGNLGEELSFTCLNCVKKRATND